MAKPAKTSVRKVPFMQSLVGRLTVIGLAPATLLAGLVAGRMVAGRSQDLEDAAHQRLMREALFVASRISDSSEGAVRAAEALAAQQEAGLFGQRALTVDLLEAQLAADPDITAAYVAYEPDADGADAASIAPGSTMPREWLDEKGRFIPYPFRDWTKGDAIAVKPLVDLETSLYYDGVRRAFAETGKARTIVTEPYVYDGQLIVEQTHPIIIDGRFRGVAGVDRALASIERIVRERAGAVGAQAYLVSTGGRFIVATEDAPLDGAARADGTVSEALRTTPVAESKIGWYAAELVQDADEDGLVSTVSDERGGEELVTASVRIDPGGWTLILVKPREVIRAPIRSELMVDATVAGVAFVLAFVLVGGVAINTGIRTGAASAAAEDMSKGNLGTEVRACRMKDEVGVLLRSLESMRASLSRIIAGVRSASVTVDTSAIELSAASREQAAMAQRFGEATAQVAAASRQISATGRELVDTMSAVERSVEETATLADSSRSGLAAVDGTIREVAQAADSIAAKLAAISERAAAINAVVAVIAKVAEQTNLLSVNAAIEAEKAGEQGRGFLVVAREIRRLADQTGAATGDIEGIVREMQSAVGAGVMEMDRFAEKVRRGVEEVTDSSRRMGEIIERVGANAERYRAVADGMQSQSQGADTISQSMAQLADAASRAIRSAEEFGRTAAELERASQLLRASVSQFTLRDS